MIQVYCPEEPGRSPMQAISYTTPPVSKTHSIPSPPGRLIEIRCGYCFRNGRTNRIVFEVGGFLDLVIMQPKTSVQAPMQPAYMLQAGAMQPNHCNARGSPNLRTSEPSRACLTQSWALVSSGAIAVAKRWLFTACKKQGYYGMGVEKGSQLARVERF